MCFYDRPLAFLQDYNGERFELFVWVDVLRHQDSSGIEWVDDVYLCCSVDVELALEIIKSPTAFCFADIYLQPGAFFFYEIDRTQADPASPQASLHYRVPVGDFSNVSTEHLPSILGARFAF